ncbi:MAG TPA: carboxypeptidase-like regulatory domain-containing protein [Candidatus Competibacteraceae bacterium]|nr:carboxypeptidase regulatory-like domain-containing protein [Candidatus Competibacteraceae bacterium]HPF57368.1 carboxypeptidase-like regulatory domain-containing protein [Candidatus Competibacteraceae bacterium]HRY17290.1 carboxypeptidase-like regulatory domain-containing protein [Candidatus Competibacteraceae bacterium]
MIMMRTMSLTAMVLGLGIGLNPLASAQQTYSAPPVYSPPPSQEPPPLSSSPRQQLPPDESGIQLYTRPDLGRSAPVSPPQTIPHSGSSWGPSGADLQEDEGPGWLPPGGLVRIQENQGIRYVSGGVGEGERSELNALSNQFNLRLLFAMQGSGDYLADVQVNIMDEGGRTVLSAQSQGPWFFTQLPPAAYRVEVSVLNQTQQQTVRVTGSRQSHLTFYWR